MVWWMAGLALLSSIAACSSGDKGQEQALGALVGAPDGPIVALVNDEVITEPLLLVYARGRGLDPTVPAQRQSALDSLIENVLLAQDARASGLLDRPEVQAEAALVRVQQLAGRRLAEQRAATEVTEEQIVALYQRERQRAGDTEWQAQHMLFVDEAAARAMLARALAPGADFAGLMQEAPSAGAGQAKTLDWSNATQLPEEIVEALKQLDDGETAPVVIRTSFGFHVLRRIAARPFNPPPIDSIRDGARRQIVEAAIKEFVDGLRTRATISQGVQQPAG
jgi:peptidyl-prolyl cis-trans isomerase C